MARTGITIDYRKHVLEIMERVLLDKTRTGRIMLEIRLTLFVAAAASPDYDRCLVPFPPCFFDRKTKAKDIQELLEYIRLIPTLDKVDPEIKLPPLMWELLYWVFTNPVTISPLFESNVVYATQTDPGTLKVIEARTKLGFPDELHTLPHRNFFFFEVKTPNPSLAFLEGRGKYGSNFAFHGSPLCNFHSIVHRGLKAALNTRSAHGHGTYLSSSWAMSNSYAEEGKPWEESIFGKTQRCVAICEIVDAPTVVKKYIAGGSFSGTTISVVADDHLIQLTYLILFGPEYKISPIEVEILAAKIRESWDKIRI